MNAEDAARARVERLRGWKSTPEQPWPSYARPPQPSRSGLDDVAAVVAGSKPLAIIAIHSDTTQERQELKALLHLAHNQHLEIEQLDGQDLLVGPKRNVEAFQKFWANHGYGPGGVREFSRHLGYHPEAVEKYVNGPFKDMVADLEQNKPLPRYKELAYEVALAIPRLISFVQERRTLRTIEHIRRQSLPPEKLGLSPTSATARDVSKTRGK